MIVEHKRDYTSSDLFSSLLVKKPKIIAGTYTLVIDCRWEHAWHPDFKKVLLRIFTGEKVKI